MRLSRARAILKEKIEENAAELMRGLIPMSLLTKILQMNADETFTAEISNDLWQGVASGIGLTSAAIASTTATATAATTMETATTATSAKGGTTAALGTTAKAAIISAVAVTIAAAATTASLWFGGVFTNAQSIEQGPPDIPQSHITFTGDPSEEYTNINPMNAFVTSKNMYGDLIPHNWRIVTIDGEVTLHTGSGATVDEELGEMIAGGEYGEYTLIFLMEDDAGYFYEISRDFSISSAY